MIYRLGFAKYAFSFFSYWNTKEKMSLNIPWNNRYCVKNSVMDEDYMDNGFIAILEIYE